MTSENIFFTLGFWVELLRNLGFGFSVAHVTYDTSLTKFMVVRTISGIHFPPDSEWPQVREVRENDIEI